jgi:hypothetical protein
MPVPPNDFDSPTEDGRFLKIAGGAEATVPVLHTVEQSGYEVRDDKRTGHTQPSARQS